LSLTSYRKNTEIDPGALQLVRAQNTLYLLTVLSPFSTPVPPNLCSTLHGGMHADARLICICTQAADADRRHHGAQVSEMLDSAAGLRPSQHQEGASRPRPRELLHSTPRPLQNSKHHFPYSSLFPTGLPTFILACLSFHSFPQTLQH